MYGQCALCTTIERALGNAIALHRVLFTAVCNALFSVDVRCNVSWAMLGIALCAVICTLIVVNCVLCKAQHNLGHRELCTLHCTVLIVLHIRHCALCAVHCISVQTGAGVGGLYINYL